VSPDKQFYHCFGCGAHGTVIGFLMQYEKLEFLDAVADLAQRAGLELPREAQGAREPGQRRSARAHGARRAILRAESRRQRPRARKYLAQTRGIDAKPAPNSRLGYAPDSWNALLNRFGAHEEERRRLLQVGLIIERDGAGRRTHRRDLRPVPRPLMFPIRDSRGRVLGFGGRIIDQGEPKYLNSPETPLFHKGRELYGLYEARQARNDFKRLMIVEGYMDVVRLHQAGITYAVATLGHRHHPGAPEQDLQADQRSGVLLRRRSRRPSGGVARARERAAAGARRTRAQVHVPARRAMTPTRWWRGGARRRSRGGSRTRCRCPNTWCSSCRRGRPGPRRRPREAQAALAAPLFARMPEGVYREMLADRLAARGRHAGGEAEGALQQRGASRARGMQRGTGGGSSEFQSRPIRTAAVGSSAGRGNLLSQAITLVLHHPGAARAVVKDPEALGGRRQARRMRCSTNCSIRRPTMAQPTTAMLLERWRERPEYGRLTELAMAPRWWPRRWGG
jgi:DNA primase